MLLKPIVPHLITYIKHDWEFIKFLPRSLTFDSDTYSYDIEFVHGIPEFLDSERKCWTLDYRRWTLDAGPWTLDAGRWTLDATLWTVGSGHWTLSLTVLEQNQKPVSDSA